MKKILRRLIIIALVGAFVPSCNLFEDCKTCYYEVNDNGSITRGPGVSTCGDALEDRESEEPVVIGNKSSYWVCE